MATQRITFCTFKPEKDFDANNMVKKVLDANSNKKYAVFSEQGTVYIRGCFYIEQLQSDSRYNFEITFTKQFALKFEIDLKNQIIMIWGNKNFVPNLLTELSIASDNSIVIEEISVDFKKTLSKISKCNNIKISRMKIIDIPIEGSITATCSINTTAIEMPQAFIEKYIENITQVSFLINDDYLDEDRSNSISATLHSSGALVVYKDKDSISDEIIDTIKGLVI